ncbi:hypothetical protein ATCC90586_000941 [Pythium insidiosum]|nr:hypothetical protein ATCC90586_000941 [Pythium insidiosum]
MRNADNLMANVEYPGIEVDEILEIEQQVKEEVQARVRRANGLFMYWHEPREFVSEEKIEHINADLEIKTLHEIYEEVATETGFDLRYARIPVSDETAPEEKDLDDMVRLVAPVFIEELGLEDRGKPVKRTAVICNCQMGRVDRDLTASKHDAYMLRAVNYLERYFYLICFASYLLEERASLFKHKLFVSWMNERYGSDLYELLDNLCFEEEVGAEIHLSSMRWRWRRKRKLVSRLE